MLGVEATISLLPRTALRKTGAVDEADWNYRPFLKVVSRLRFKLIQHLLGARRYGRLLEIGYGSGVFLPELARHCEALYGIDVHHDTAAVSQTLQRYGVAARLLTASATALPFASDTFDAVVAVSALEFVDDIDAACEEIRRVLRPAGVFVAVTPGDSALLDFGLKVLTGRNARADFGERRGRIIPALSRHFDIDEYRTSPPLVPIYSAARVMPRRGA